MAFKQGASPIRPDSPQKLDLFYCRIIFQANASPASYSLMIAIGELFHFVLLPSSMYGLRRGQVLNRPQSDSALNGYPTPVDAPLSLRNGEGGCGIGVNGLQSQSRHCCQRIGRRLSETNFKVQVRAGRVARAADPADHRPRRDDLAAPYRDTAQVSV